MEIAHGTVEGTGAAIAVSIGFEPSWVELINIDGDAILKWTTNMGTGTGYKIIAAGTNALVATGGITVDSTDDSTLGFSIGTDSDVNVSEETIVYLAGR